MKRCGIERADGVIRIGILCQTCESLALSKLVSERRRFWSRDYYGPEICEACHDDDSMATEQ